MHLLKSLEGEAYTLGTYSSYFLEIVNGLIFSINCLKVIFSIIEETQLMVIVS